MEFQGNELMKPSSLIRETGLQLVFREEQEEENHEDFRYKWLCDAWA